ncbi:NHL domain protein [Quillaja saponaria]|uniref:NHL domain protein n=1 Tax=Quillaja saponaria TaxID=32244 RepID=A0AAD7KTS9_QUISA|nr:NHL domain protein [Quillaja saponaria]
MSHIDPELVGEERSNSLLANTRCCFCLPCFRSRRSSSTVGFSWWGRVGSNSGSYQNEDKWWSPGVKSFKKIREWSELVAGPKWKTFIRRFNRNRSGVVGGGGRHGKFQYDPLSYALNFDEGPRENANLDGDEYDGFRNFSTRYAAVPGPVPINSAAPPIDLGNDLSVFAAER